MDLFKVSGDSSATAVPQRVECDRTKDQRALEEVRQQRVNHLDAQAKERERIQRLNARFKNL